MYTVRIDVLEPAELDGATPLDLFTATVTVPETPLNIAGVVVPVGTPFGIFDPGEILHKQNVAMRLVSLVVQNDAGTTLVAGDVVRLEGPDLPAGGNQDAAFLDLSVGDGLIPLSGLLVPVGHTLSFTTAGSGAVGPFRIQMGFSEVDLAHEYFAVNAGSA